MNIAALRRIQIAIPVVLGILASVLACFWQMAQHPMDLLVGVQWGGMNDVTAWYLPHREYPLQVLKHDGQLPFWNPWVAGGAPFLGGFQTALFYPFNWLYWVVPATSLISWDLIAHHVIAVVGAYCLGRRLGASRLGATFAAIAYGLSPVLVARTGAGHLTSLGTVAWYPWVFFAYEGLLRGRRFALLGAAATLSLSFLAGHPQEFYYLVLTISLLCLADMTAYAVAGRGRDSLRLGLLWAVAGLGSISLVAVELIPLAVHLTQISSQARLQAPMSVTPGLSNLWQLIFPFVLGGPSRYQGEGTHFWETICYFGIIPLGLAALGGAVSLRSGSPIIRISAIGLVSLILGFGDRTPLHWVMSAIVPGYASFRCPGRWFMMTALAVALTAAFGIDDLARAHPNRVGRMVRRFALAVAAFAVLGLLMYLGMHRISDSLNNYGSRLDLSLANWLLEIPLAASFVAIGIALIGCFRMTRSTAHAAMILPLVVMELATFSNSILTTISPASFPRLNPIIKRINSQSKQGRLFATQFDFTDGEAFRAHLQKYQGYDPLPLDRIVRFTSVMLSPDYTLAKLEGFYKLEMRNARLPLLDLWSIRYIATSPDDDLPNQRTEWKSLGSCKIDWMTMPRNAKAPTRTCEIWENPSALPRGFVIGRARVRAEKETEDDALRTLRPHEEVLVDQDLLPSGARQEFTPASFAEDTPNRITLDVETARPGYLVLTDSWYPGWVATIDGQPSDVLHADLAFRAVALSRPGKHRVVFSYFPPGLIAGLAVSVTALCTAILYGMIVARKPALRLSESP